MPHGESAADELVKPKPTDPEAAGHVSHITAQAPAEGRTRIQADACVGESGIVGEARVSADFISFLTDTHLSQDKSLLGNSSLCSAVAQDKGPDLIRFLRKEDIPVQVAYYTGE